MHMCELIKSCRHCDSSPLNTSAAFPKKKVILLYVHHHFLTRKIKNKSLVLSIEQATVEFPQLSPKYPFSCFTFEPGSNNVLTLHLVFSSLESFET